MQKNNVIMLSSFKKDYKTVYKRGYDMTLLQDVVTKLANGEPLPEKNRDHALTGESEAVVNVISNRIGC